MTNRKFPLEEFKNSVAAMPEGPEKERLKVTLQEYERQAQNAEAQLQRRQAQEREQRKR